MPHGYCTGCQARVTVQQGRCLLGHPVDATTISNTRGRRAVQNRAAQVGATQSPTAQSGTVQTRRLTVSRHMRNQPAPEMVSPSGFPPIPADPQPGPTPIHYRRPRVLATETIAQIDLTEDAPLVILADAPQPRRFEVLAPTGSLIERLWLQETPEIFLDYQLEAETIELPEWDRRRFFKPLAALAAMVALTVFIIGNDGSKPVQRLDAAFGVLAQTVSELAAPLADFADGVVDDSLSGPLVGADLDRAAKEILVAAAELPVNHPLRKPAIDKAQKAVALQRAVADTIAYDTLSRSTLSTIRLPSSPTVADLPLLTEEVSLWSQSIKQRLNRLPNNPALETDREAMMKLLNDLALWETTYLDAVRDGALTPQLGAEANRLITNRLAGLTRTVSSLSSTLTADAQALGA